WRGTAPSLRDGACSVPLGWGTPVSEAVGDTLHSRSRTPFHYLIDRLPMKRYEALAGDIETSIRSGLLQPGDRLPSVRSLCSSRGISASTVFQAYYLLE